MIRNATEEAVKQVEAPSLQLYGFADFGVSAVLHDGTRSIQGFFGQSPSFGVGNLNLYLAGDLTANFKSGRRASSLHPKS